MSCPGRLEKKLVILTQQGKVDYKLVKQISKSLFVKGIDNAYLKEIAAFSLLIVRL